MRRLHRVLTGLFFCFTFLVGNDVCEAFHNGGVGACSGCHSIHSSSGIGNSLLQSADPSSICLNCHSGLGRASTISVYSLDGIVSLTPGGDFYWLGKDFFWTTGTSPGETHGHNVVAQDYGLMADMSRPNAPGGSYPSASLSCTSCHDPHGRANGGTAQGSAAISGSGSYGGTAAANTILGNYRLLGGVNYKPNGEPGYDFSHASPVAVQSAFNKFGESDISHVAYGFGMSEWCTNCHLSYQTGEHSGTFEHPSGNFDNLDSDIINHYNTYVRTGDFSGTTTTAYLQFVPFERGTTETALLNPTGTQGPDSNSNVMCLTCHRAHASAFRAAGRWDFDAVLLADSHPALGDGGVLASDVLYSYYGRNIEAEFGAGQKQFCEKCHNVDGP